MSARATDRGSSLAALRFRQLFLAADTPLVPIDDTHIGRDKSWKKSRDVHIANCLCLLLGLGEYVQQQHYRAMLQWRDKISADIAQGKPPSSPAPMLLCLPFLRGLKKCARESYGLMGIAPEIPAPPQGSAPQNNTGEGPGGET